MKNAQHTPGPWEILPPQQGQNKTFDIQGRGTGSFFSIAKVGGPSNPESKDELAANINLITAAPDLLDRLIEVETVLRWAAQEATGRIKAEIVGGWVHHADAAHAAIVKAGGGVPCAR